VNDNDRGERTQPIRNARVQTKAIAAGIPVFDILEGLTAHRR
jgi:hypothetical protein